MPLKRAIKGIASATASASSGATAIQGLVPAGATATAYKNGTALGAATVSALGVASYTLSAGLAAGDKFYFLWDLVGQTPLFTVPGTPPVTVTPPNANWRLGITGAPTDSANNSTVISSVQQSSANKRHASVPITGGTARVLTIPVSAIAAPGGLVYIYSSFTDGTFTVEQSVDGSAWTTCSVASGRLASKGIAYGLAAQAAGFVRITTNSSGGGSLKLGLFQRSSSGYDDIWLVYGPSFEDISDYCNLWTANIQGSYPSADPIVFTEAVAGNNTAQIATIAQNTMAQHQLATIVNANQGGNSVTDQRPYSKTHGNDGFATFPDDLDRLIKAITDAGKRPIVQDISFRDYTNTPLVNSNANPENGSLPFNQNIVWPKWASKFPAQVDPDTGVPYVSPYGWALTNRTTGLASDGIHPSPNDGYRAYMISQMGPTIYGGTRPISIYEQAVVNAEANNTAALRAKALELVNVLPSSSKRTSLLGRINALGGVTLQTLTLSSTAFTPGTAFSANISGKTPGSTVTATASDGTALTVASNGVTTAVFVLSGTFPSNSSPNVTLSESMLNAANTPKATVVPVTVGSGGGTSVPSNTAVPTISGTPQVGQTLTASQGAWSNSPTAYAYQWYRLVTSGGNTTATAISGATGSTYVPVAADVGNTLDVVVVASNGAGSSQPALSAATATVIAASTTAPGQVTGLTLGTATASTQPLSWTAPTSGGAPTSYLMEYRKTGDTAWTSGGTSTSTSGTVSGLTAATGYDYRVTASNNGGSGSPSATATGSTAAAASGRTAQAHVNSANPANVANWAEVNANNAVTPATAVALPDTSGATTGWAMYMLSGPGVQAQNFGAPSGSKIYADGLYNGIFGNKGSPQTMRITGLNPAKKYRTDQLGCRTGGTGRITDYTVNGTVVTVDNSDNPNRLATHTNLSPDASGNLDLKCDGNTGSSYWYLSTIVITELS